MTIDKMPNFMEHQDWYIIKDKKRGILEPTKNAPQEAIIEIQKWNEDIQKMKMLQLGV